MTKSIKYLIVNGCVLLTMTSCSQLDEAWSSLGNVPVALSQRVVGTRVAQNLNEGFITTGEDILVKMTDGQSQTLDYLYTAGESGALAAKSGTVEAFYPQEGSVDIAAWYPATATAEFAVQNDQREDDDYKASDLMFAKATDKNRHSGEVDLAFRHQMAKLKVNVTVGADLSEVTNIRLMDIQRSVTIDLLTGEVSTVVTDDGHPASDIRMSNNGAVLFPPQRLDGQFIEVSTAEGAALFVLDGEGKNFEAGKEYTLNITLTTKSIGAAGIITDWEGEGAYTLRVGHDLYELVINDIPDETYDYGNTLTPLPVVAYNGRVLTVNVDYKLNYIDNINAGTATVVATGLPGSPCSGRAGAKTFTIRKATPVINAPTSRQPGLVYNTQAQVLADVGSTSGGTLKYSLTEDGVYTTDMPEGTEAGDYTVWFRVEGNENFLDVDPQPLHIVIDKAQPDITIPTVIDGLVFSGSAQQLITAGNTTATCVMQYSLDSETWTDDATTIKAANAGTHNVYYRIVGNSNYYDVTASYVSTPIAKATPVIVMETGTLILPLGNSDRRTATRVFVDNNSNGTWDEGIDYDITNAAEPRYSSSKVATVDVDNVTGVLTPYVVGSAHITATVLEKDNWNQQELRYMVVVKNLPGGTLPDYSDPIDNGWQ